MTVYWHIQWRHQTLHMFLKWLRHIRLKDHVRTRVAEQGPIASIASISLGSQFCTGCQLGLSFDERPIRNAVWWVTCLMAEVAEEWHTSFLQGFFTVFFMQLCRCLARVFMHPKEQQRYHGLSLTRTDCICCTARFRSPVASGFSFFSASPLSAFCNCFALSKLARTESVIPSRLWIIVEWGFKRAPKSEKYYNTVLALAQRRLLGCDHIGDHRYQLHFEKEM